MHQRAPNHPQVFKISGGGPPYPPMGGGHPSHILPQGRSSCTKRFLLPRLPVPSRLKDFLDRQRFFLATSLLQSIFIRAMDNCNQSEDALKQAVSMKRHIHLSRHKFDMVCKTQSSVLDPSNIKTQLFHCLK